MNQPLPFPSRYRVPRITKLMSQAAVDLLVEHMLLHSAAYMPGVVEIDAVDALKDGGLALWIDGEQYKVTIEPT